MIQDARELPDGTTVQADVCIIGSGAAGLSLAKQFLGHSSIKVLVLESGGYEADDATKALAQGTNIGRSYFPIEVARSRYFGGSTNCWAGLCLPLQAVDFEKRDYLPHSGWPITREDLNPFYSQAQTLLELGPFDYDPATWSTDSKPPYPLDGGPLEGGLFQMSPPTRVGSKWRSEFASAQNVDVLLHANVTRLGLAPQGGRLDQLDVKTLSGTAFTVNARHYVLATGGLENPRVLLSSNDVNPKGVGNDHDLVGRFFMEHPHTDREGLIVASPNFPGGDMHRAYRLRGTRVWKTFKPSDELIRREKILNFSMVLLAYNPKRGKLNHALTDAISRATGEADIVLQSPRPALSDSPLLFTLGTPSEQAPNPDSRVTLTNERDALGVQRLALDWKLSDIDKTSLKRAHELMAMTLARAGLGRMRVTLDDDPKSWPKQMRGGWHHLGTTRMASNAQDGVVDENCTVFGVDNLSIAGSSVFTTGGAANPTLTIVALALRLAEHLKGKLS